MSIKNFLQSVDFPSHFRPRYGHCREIAVALHDVFGGQLIAISRTPNTKGLDHIFVRKNELDFDGRGEICVECVYTDYTQSSNQKGVEEHTWVVSPEYIRRVADFDEEIYRQAKSEMLTR